MAKYKVLTRSFINNAIREEGEIVEYEGRAGSNLEPLDEPKRGKGKSPDAESKDELV